MYRLYIGNLPYSTRSEQLRSFFESCGAVKDATVILDADHRSKGFGFVEFEDEAGFKKGLEMNEQEMEGRALRINEARPREDRDGQGGGAPAAAPMAEDKPADEAAMPEAPAAMDETADAAAEEDEDGDDDEEEDDEEDAEEEPAAPADEEVKE